MSAYSRNASVHPRKVGRTTARFDLKSKVAEQSTHIHAHTLDWHALHAFVHSFIYFIWSDQRGTNQSAPDELLEAEVVLPAGEVRVLRHERRHHRRAALSKPLLKHEGCPVLSLSKPRPTETQPRPALPAARAPLETPPAACVARYGTVADALDWYNRRFLSPILPSPCLLSLALGLLCLADVAFPLYLSLLLSLSPCRSPQPIPLWLCSQPLAPRTRRAPHESSGKVVRGGRQQVAA